MGNVVLFCKCFAVTLQADRSLIRLMHNAQPGSDV